jgi:hypothetical protein
MSLRVHKRFAAVLLVCLLAGQALAVAHAYEHAVLDELDHSCMVCAHGQGPDDVLAADDLAVHIPFAPADWADLRLHAVRHLSVLAPCSRGPPRILHA